MADYSSVPHAPGCYMFSDKRERIIYVGKAKDLQKRVGSYFQKRGHDAKTELLVSQIYGIDFIVTTNEIEALILENNLIKKNQPKFNISLKDSKRYAYLMLTDEKFPRLLLARKRQGKGRFFGPFVSAQERDYVRSFVIKAFKIRTCKKMPKRPCLRFHIDLCKAPCIGNISLEDYNARVHDASRVLKGRTDSIIRSLNSRMKQHSESMEYELALEIREQVRGLEYLAQRQMMERQEKHDEDVINFIEKGGDVFLALFNVLHGTMLSKHEYTFAAHGDYLEEFIVQYYSEHPIPKVIIVPIQLDGALEGFLSSKAGRNVRLQVPLKGEKKMLLDLVYRNVEMTFFSEQLKLEALMKALRLQEMPKVIECFDISHLSGTFIVGSMVQFRGGKPDKSNYRRFRVRTVEKIDDFASIFEVVRRRYRRLMDERSQMPNLIVIDGGKGQLSAALEALSSIEVKIPVISLAKRLEEIFVPGLVFPIRLDKKDKALQFLQQVRDEAHRFAISYNRLLRSKGIRESQSRSQP